MFYATITFLISVASGNLVYDIDKKYVVPRAPADGFVTTKNGRSMTLRDADTSQGAAETKCREFYTGRDDALQNGITVSLLGEGGQSMVYKCATNTAGTDLPGVAVKLYRRPWEFRLEEREIIDTQLGELGIGPHVYEFFWEPGHALPSYSKSAGKIEDLLTGENIGYEHPDEPEVYRHVAKALAQVHSIKKEDMNVPVHFDTEIWPWNTKLVLEHLNQEWFKEAAHEKIWGILKMNTSLDVEFAFADEKIKESKTPTTWCHNDPHPENMMVDRDNNGNYKWDTFYLIDFDNAAWGYRAWDIDYYFSKWDKWPDTETMEDFIDSYLEEFSGTPKVTKSELLLELRLHQPYLLMEQMFFYYGFLNGYTAQSHVDAYCDVMLNYFNRPVTCGTGELSMSLTVIIFSLLSYFYF